MLLAIIVVLVASATAVALFMGLSSMALGGAYDRHHSGQLMSTRVGLQLLAVVLVMLAAYLAVR